ncbi:MAG: response regulator [bacterium]
MLILLLPSIFYAAFYYSRWIFVSITLVIAGISVWVIWHVSHDEIYYSLFTLGFLIVSILAGAEMVYRATGHLRRVRDDLLESEERWRSLALNAPHLFVLVNREGIIVFQNRPLWGDESPVRTGSRLMEILSPRMREPMAEGLRRVFESGEAGTTELACDVPGAGRDWFRVWIGPMRRDRQPMAMIVSIEITGQKLAAGEKEHLEKQLHFYQKMEAVGQLAGGVAHDFNNLLTVIEGYSDMALSRLPSTDPLYNDVVEIRKAADRAVAITSQLLAFSRKQIYQPRVLDLNTIVTDMERMLRRLIGENIELVTVCGEDLLKIKADPGQIEQVIVNLAVNARDAMPLGGRLVIETANACLDSHYAAHHVDVQSGEFVKLTVSDTGHGMDAQIQSRMFEPFFTTKACGKGTGLGLSTVYGIVKQNQGHIEVVSEPGKGASFRIYFPQAGATASPPPPKPEPVLSTQGSETILLVEDEDTVLNLVRRSLEECEFKVLSAGCGKEALDIAKNHPGDIDLLVTDLVMPGLNGHELAAHIRRIRPGVKILYMSGYTEDAMVRQGLMDPDIAFIQKPFTPLTLIQKIQHVLDPD